MQTSQKLSSHFADFEQVKKLSSYLTDFEQVGHGCFLDILLNPSYPCLSVKIFSFLFIRYGCTCILTGQVELRKTKIHSQFLISLMLLHCLYNKKLNTAKMSNNKSYKLMPNIWVKQNNVS